MIALLLRVERLPEGYGRTPPCQRRSKLRNESIGRAQYPCWGRPGYHCRWRAAHPRQPRDRQRIYRRKTPERVTTSLSVRRKSLTSAWRRSMSSTRKMPEYPGPTYNLPTGEAAEAAEAAAAATELAGLGGELAGLGGELRGRLWSRRLLVLAGRRSGLVCLLI